MNMEQLDDYIEHVNATLTADDARKIRGQIIQEFVRQCRNAAAIALENGDWDTADARLCDALAADKDEIRRIEDMIASEK